MISKHLKSKLKTLEILHDVSKQPQRGVIWEMIIELKKKQRGKK